MDILLNASPVASPNDIKGLCHLHDQVESHVWGLQSLGVAPESYGSLLSSVLLNKLPQELQLIISRKITDDTWSLDHLTKELEQELEARERAATTSGSPNTNPSGRQVPELPTFIVVIASRLIPLAHVQL